MRETSPQEETLTPQVPAWRVQRFESLDSTNRFILDQARSGAKEGLVAVADEQVSGRGRLGRRWLSPKGSSFSASVLFGCSDRDGVATAQRLVRVVSLAMSYSLSEIYEVDARIKWPNDLEIDGEKVAGVLSELCTTGSELSVVVGVGVNLLQSKGELDLLSRPATSISMKAPDKQDLITVDVLLDVFLSNLSKWLLTLRSGAGLSEIALAYRCKCSTIGERVRVELPGGSLLSGVATSVGEDGELVVRGADGEVAVHAGDVFHLRVERDLKSK